MTDRTHDCPDGWDSGQLLAYLEGDLEAAERTELELHLSRCEACSREMQDLRQVHSLLLEHPGAFHPSEQELFLLAKYGEDPGGSLSEHLKSCPDCASDLEMLREMESVGHAWSEEGDNIPRALLDRLKELHSAESAKPSVGATWFSEALEWFKGPFRLPVFGLATAVAAVVVIVLAVPMSRVLDDGSLPTIGSIEEKVAEPIAAPKPAAPPADQTTEDGLDERSKSRRILDREGLSRKQEIATPMLKKDKKGKPVPSRYGKWSRESSTLRPSKADKFQRTEPNKAGKLAGPKRRFRSDPRSEQPSSTPRSHGLPAPSTFGAAPGRVSLPDAVPKEAKKRLFSVKPPGRPPAVQAPTAGTRAPAETTRQRVRSELEGPPVGAQSPVDSRMIVSLRIIDENGQDISWLAFSPPPGLTDRYRFVRETREQPDDASIRTKPSSEYGEAESQVEIDGKEAFTISIQVGRSGAMFDLRASMMELGTRRHIKTIEALNVSRIDLPDRVRSLVSSMLETR